MFKRVISRDDGAPWGHTGLNSKTWLDVPVYPVLINNLIATQPGVYFDALIKMETPVGGDKYPHVVMWDGEMYLEDGHTRVTRAMLDGKRSVDVRIWEM